MRALRRAATLAPPILIALFVMTLLVLAGVRQLWFAGTLDKDLFAYYGWRVSRGAVLYVDVWDNKPPLLFWLNALALRLADEHLAGVALLVMGAGAGASAALFVAARRLYATGTAWLVVLLGSAYLLHPHFLGGSNRTENFVVLFELVAAAAYLVGWQRDRAGWILLAGVSAGCAALSKQVGVAALGAMTLHLLAVAAVSPTQRRRALVRLGALLGGAALSLAVAATVLWLQGAFDEAWHAIVAFNRAYLVDRAGRPPWTARAAAALWSTRGGGAALLMLAALGAAWGAGRAGTAPVPHKAWLVAWALLAGVGLAASPNAYALYLPPILPPLLLLAGGVLERLASPHGWRAALRDRAWTALALATLALVVAPLWQLQWRSTRQAWHQRTPHCEGGGAPFVIARTPLEHVGRRIADLTQPDDRIQGFGYLPTVYLAARRPNAVRFATTEKLAQLPALAWLRDEVRDALRDDPPTLLFSSSTSWRNFWDDGGEGCRAADAWRASHYDLVETCHGLELYLRRDALAAPRAAPDNASP